MSLPLFAWVVAAAIFALSVNVLLLVTKIAHLQKRVDRLEEKTRA